MPDLNAPHAAAPNLGIITRGSLSEGLQLKLEPGTSIEDMRVGRFVVINGKHHRFFCLVTDMELGATNPRVLLDPPSGARLAGEVLDGIATFGQVAITPMLMMPYAASAGDTPGVEGPELQPVRTIPVHFSPVFDATDDDFGSVFGRPGGTRFEVGKPLNAESPICINLERLVERSNGVFGKSGTGKSFLTRLLLSGVIASDVASTLVFDMHSEYGWETQSEEGGPSGTVLPGLRRLFGTRVHVYALDRSSARARGVQVDGFLDIGLNEIEIEDIALLQDELGLSGAMIDSCYILQRQFGDDWLRTLLETEPESIKNMAAVGAANEASIAALYRKLSRLRAYDFVKDHLPSGGGAIDEMMGWLERGEHVVLEFGRHRQPLVYMLVANIITRRIYASWVERTERYLLTKNAADQPRRLVLCIEEAHKFLNPRAARNTSFGSIAREMRKYNVTLLIVDQRPSGIDPEVASQLGTRLTALLTEESDIRAVFSGVSGGDQLRAVLASLDTKKQALILGHAVPMPVVVRVRPYDKAFFGAVAPGSALRPVGMAALQEAFG